jgi:hypothetical protein
MTNGGFLKDFWPPGAKFEEKFRAWILTLPLKYSIFITRNWVIVRPTRMGG